MTGLNRELKSIGNNIVHNSIITSNRRDFNKINAKTQVYKNWFVVGRMGFEPTASSAPGWNHKPN